MVLEQLDIHIQKKKKKESLWKTLDYQLSICICLVKIINKKTLSVAICPTHYAQDFKESACSVEDMSSISGSGRSTGEENGCPLQYSCLENSMDRGAWWATIHGVTKSQT